jgi:hypothetical protein
MLRRVAHVQTGVSKELTASIIWVPAVGEIGELAVISNRSTLHYFTVCFGCWLLLTFSNTPILVILIMEIILSSETPVLKEPQGATSQKTAFFIVFAVKTSNLNILMTLP